jgi:hypothetical protein
MPLNIIGSRITAMTVSTIPLNIIGSNITAMTGSNIYVDATDRVWRVDTVGQVQEYRGQIYTFFRLPNMVAEMQENRRKWSETAAILNIINCYTLTMFIIYTYFLETNVEMKQKFP